MKNDYKADKIVSLPRGKSYTTSSRQTPPGSEGSKGKMVERCDIRSLPLILIYDWTIVDCIVGCEFQIAE